MKKFASVFIVAFLTGCSSNSIVNQLPGVSPTPQVNMSELYLRGVFNWWEATPAYLLSQGREGWYVDIELIADGQPYDFKVANSVWTPAQTCGGNYQGQQVTVSDTASLICGDEAQNLQFTPNTTGIYRFIFEKTDADQLELTVRLQSR